MLSLVHSKEGRKMRAVVPGLDGMAQRGRIMYKISAIFIGFLVALMVTANGVLAKGAGDMFSVLIIHMVGLVAISIILLVTRKKFSSLRGIPIYLFSAGAIGVFTVLFNNMTINQLGVSLTVAMALFGQSIASVIIDHYGLLGMEVHKFQKEKIVGFLMIGIGIVFLTIY